MACLVSLLFCCCTERRSQGGLEAGSQAQALSGGAGSWEPGPGRRVLAKQEMLRGDVTGLCLMASLCWKDFVVQSESDPRFRQQFITNRL